MIVSCFFLGEPHLPHHLCPLLDLCDSRAHDCFSRGDRFPISFLRNSLGVRNFLYFHLLGIGCAIIFTGVPVYFIIVSDDYVKKPEYVRRLLGKASLITLRGFSTLPLVIFILSYFKNIIEKS